MYLVASTRSHLLNVFPRAPAEDCLSRNYNPCIPSILVIFDYNAAGIPLQPGLTVTSSASMWIGVTNNTGDIFRTTLPSTLLTNVHQLGSFTFNV